MDEDCLRGCLETIYIFWSTLITSLIPNPYIHQEDREEGSDEEFEDPIAEEKPSLESIRTREELDTLLAQIEDEDERAIFEMDWYEMQYKMTRN